MKISWKVWVTALLCTSSLLLILVLYLMYQREVLDSIEAKAEKFLGHTEKRMEAEHSKLIEAQWKFHVNSTQEHWEHLQKHIIVSTNLIHEIQHNLTGSEFYHVLSKLGASTERQRRLMRKFDVVLNHAPSPSASVTPLLNLKLTSSKLRHFNHIVRISNEIWNSEIKKIQSASDATRLNGNWSAKIFYEYEKQLASTYWTQFHDETSLYLKSYIKPFVQLLNENALLNQFANYKDFLLSTEYELKLKERLHGHGHGQEDAGADIGSGSDSSEARMSSSKEFITQMYDLWYNLKPLYDEFHAYVRAEIGHVYNWTSTGAEKQQRPKTSSTAIGANGEKSDEDDNDNGEEDDDNDSDHDHPGNSTTPPPVVVNTGGGTGTIPEQFFGFTGINSRSGWGNVYSVTKPYTGRNDVNVDHVLRSGKFNNMITLAKMVENYLVLLDFPAMPPSFWSESLFGGSNWTEYERDSDSVGTGDGASESQGQTNQTHVHAQSLSHTHIDNSRRNCCNSTTFYESVKLKELKIAICGSDGEMNEESFKNLIRLMVRVKVHMIRRSKSFWFRKSTTNALERGFEEALVLAMTRPTQLVKFGFADEDYIEDSPSYLNYLYKEALQDLPIMIQALATFRWSLEFFGASAFSTTSTTSKRNMFSLENYNRRWWMLRQNLIGVRPPEPRPSTVDYTSILTTNRNPLEDYITIVLKYQIYKSLCIWANESDGSPEDLVTCDITKSPFDSRGRSKIVSILELGSSKPWTEILRLISNQTTLDTDPMLDYFEPLHEYLEDRNERRGLQIGWPRLLRSDPLEMLRMSHLS